jgi:hypothetical protein
MKFDFKFNSKSTLNIDIKHVAEVASRTWQKMHVLLFFVGLFIFIAIGGYIWKQNIYSGEWSNEKKQEYINTQNKEVIFKEDDFQKVFDDISSRKEENSKEYQPIKDIFKPY